MTDEHVITPDDRCPCGQGLDDSGSGYCSYKCYCKYDLGSPIERASLTDTLIANTKAHYQHRTETLKARAERAEAELTSMRAGAGYAVDAGAAYLVEVKRLEAELAEQRAAHEKFVEDVSLRMPADVDGEDAAEAIILDWVKDAADALTKVGAFVHARREFVRVLRQYSTEDMADYHRWTGHAEARRELAETLGLELDPEAGGLLTPPEAGRV